MRTLSAHQPAAVDAEWNHVVEDVDTRSRAALPTLASLADGRPNTLTDVAKQYPLEPSQQRVAALMDQVDATHRAEQGLEQANATQRAQQQSAILSEFRTALQSLETDAVLDARPGDQFSAVAEQLISEACDALDNLDSVAKTEEVLEEMRRLVLASQTRVVATRCSTQPNLAALHAEDDAEAETEASDGSSCCQYFHRRISGCRRRRRPSNR